MSFTAINDHCFYWEGSVNIGYVNKGESGLLIDAGLDRSSIKKVLKEIRKRDLPLTHLFITHAHADHYGGASYVQEQYDVHTMAAPLEEAVLRYPQLEPLYLSGGNDPVPELNNKFLQGPPVRIDDVVGAGKFPIGEMEGETFFLPGHSYHQLGIKVEGVLYAADSYFGIDTLHKHKIPYLTDAHAALESLRQLRNIPCEGSLPGHGEYETDHTAVIDANIAYHEGILHWLHRFIIGRDGVSQEEVITAMCSRYEVETKGLSQFLLYRTAVTAYLIGLKKAGLIEDRVEGNRWMFHSASHAENI
ncbi:UNVERIFIED_CONTAM: MBL fold metallo-hydrolase [Halobacillus marinus]